MQGGAVFWAVNGVQFSSEVLTDEGFTPALPLDLNITDLLFKYGIRVNNRILQDLQCLSEPVDVSQNPQIPQYQPMPLVFSPLLLTSSGSPVTRNVSPVSTPFASDIDIVGEDNNLKHIILLASSEYATLVPTPSKIDLEDLSVDPSRFTLSYLPVAVATEGQFSSLYAHRAVPQNVKSGDKRSLSVGTIGMPRQVRNVPPAIFATTGGTPLFVHSLSKAAIALGCAKKKEGSFQTFVSSSSRSSGVGAPFLVWIRWESAA